MAILLRYETKEGKLRAALCERAEQAFIAGEALLFWHGARSYQIVERDPNADADERVILAKRAPQQVQVRPGGAS